MKCPPEIISSLRQPPSLIQWPLVTANIATHCVPCEKLSHTLGGMGTTVLKSPV